MIKTGVKLIEIGNSGKPQGSTASTELEVSGAQMIGAGLATLKQISPEVSAAIDHIAIMNCVSVNPMNNFRENCGATTPVATPVAAETGQQIIRKPAGRALTK